MTRRAPVGMPGGMKDNFDRMTLLEEHGALSTKAKANFIRVLRAQIEAAERFILSQNLTNHKSPDVAVALGWHQRTPQADAPNHGPAKIISFKGASQRLQHRNTSPSTQKEKDQPDA